MSKKVVTEDLDTKDNGTAAEATLAPNSKPGGSPEKSKTELMAAVVAAMGGVEHGDLTKFAESLKMNTGANQSKSEDGDKEKNVASITAKGVAASAMKEDVIEMFKGNEGMTEELLTKATTLFEAAVNMRVNLEVVRINEELETANKTSQEEVVKTLNEEMINRVDQYLSFAVAEWAKENQVQIDESIKATIAIDFMKGMKKLFKEHYVKIPKKKLDVVETLSVENAELQKKLDEITKTVVEQTAKLNKATKHDIVETMATGLSVTQVEKFKGLVESVDFESAEAFTKSAEIIREQYFPKTPKNNGKDLLNEDDKGIAVNAEGKPVNDKGEVIAETVTEVLDPEMKAYVETLDRHIATY